MSGPDDAPPSVPLDARAALALEDIEMDLFVEALHRRHGYDFRGYGRASLTRRVRNLASAMGVPTLDGLGADGDSAHTLHEHILVSTLEARLNFWRHLLAHLA